MTRESRNVKAPVSMGEPKGSPATLDKVEHCSIDNFSACGKMVIGR